MIAKPEDIEKNKVNVCKLYEKFTDQARSLIQRSNSYTCKTPQRTYQDDDFITHRTNSNRFEIHDKDGKHKLSIALHTETSPNLRKPRRTLLIQFGNESSYFEINDGSYGSDVNNKIRNIEASIQNTFE